MAYDSIKLKGLFDRVYNNKMIENDQMNDANDIKEYCSKVFGNGSFNPDPSLLHQFNNLVVQQADEIAKPKVDDIIGILATVKRGNRGDIIKYDIPQKTKVKFRWSATGSGVDLVRVENKKSEVAVPERFSTGFYYEPMDFVSDAVGAFQDLINKLADAKVKLYFTQMNKLTTAAISAGDIPAKNVISGNNLTITQYNTLASTIARYGGRPIFVADTLLIDYFAMLQNTDTNLKNLLSDKTKDELLMALNVSTIGRTTAINLVNPFIDDANTKTELPVNIGYMFAGSSAQKPFVVVEFGGLRQATEQDIEDERVKIKLFQDADIELMYGSALGYVKEDSGVSI
jgi:hypothetical protein